MGKLRHTTFAGKKERDIISASAEISRGNVDKGAGIIKDFRDTVKLTMQEKGYGTKEVSGAELSVDEIVPDALNYCEPCTLTAAANITSKYALMKFSWRQAEGADLAHLKPPHLNPSDKVLSLLLGRPEEAVAAAAGAEREPVAVP